MVVMMVMVVYKVSGPANLALQQRGFAVIYKGPGVVAYVYAAL